MAAQEPQERTRRSPFEADFERVLCGKRFKCGMDQVIAFNFFLNWSFIIMYIYISIYICIYIIIYVYMPVVPHKAVAEVSRIGNL